MNIETICIANKNRNGTPLFVGKGTQTRLVVNIGLRANGVSSPEAVSLEIEKAKVAIEKGADIIADVSISNAVGLLRKRLLKDIRKPISTVPLYDTCIETLKKHKPISEISKKNIIETIRQHAEDGVDIITLHAAFSQELFQLVRRSRRVIPISSRAGALLAAYMSGKKENPLLEYFEEILEILRDHRVVLSLGSALRSGSVADGLHEVYLKEIMLQGELVKKAFEYNVQTMVEGVGHMDIGAIPICIETLKKACLNAPLRPMAISTDIATGNDHISGAIASAIAAFYGAALICCMTRCEHIGFPRKRDIEEAVITYKIAAHIADIAKNNDVEADRLLSIARRKRDWKNIFQLALEKKHSYALFKKLTKDNTKPYCTMCNSLCALKLSEKYCKKENQDSSKMT